MKRLIVLIRNDQAVVSGKVTKIEDNGKDAYRLRIENEVQLPISGGERKGAINALFPKKIIDRMKMREGSFVMAVTSCQTGMDIIATGGECDKLEYDVDGFEIFYSGELKFSEYGGFRTETVLFGTVTNVYVMPDKGWREYTVVYRSNGKNIMRRFSSFKEGEMVRNVRENRRYIFVGGNYKCAESDGVMQAVLTDVWEV